MKINFILDEGPIVYYPNLNRYYTLFVFFLFDLKALTTYQIHHHSLNSGVENDKNQSLKNISHKIIVVILPTDVFFR